MNARTTVIVSSTVRDLADHRDAVLKACLEAGVFPRMMEHLPATNAEAVATSTKMVDEADVYLGVFAHRYGHVPPDAERSVTQMEYERAIQRDIPRLIFLIDDDYRGLRKADVEIGRNAERLEALKARLRTERVVKFFTSPEDLRANVILALRPYADTATGGATGSDLNISQLSSPRRLTPLDGHPVLTLSDGESPVFTGGCNVSFTLSHNGVGHHPIHLYGMELEVLRFEPRVRPDLTYRVDGADIIGAGVTKPHVFSVSLLGEEVQPAQWVTNAKLGTVAQAKSANFFDTHDPQILTFKSKDADIEELNGTVLADVRGLYNLRFIFHYSVAGNDRTKPSEAVHVYSDE